VNGSVFRALFVETCGTLLGGKTEFKVQRTVLRITSQKGREGKWRVYELWIGVQINQNQNTV